MKILRLPIHITSLACACFIGLSSHSVHADDALSGMISPISNPVNFEDPRIRSEIRPIFLYHKIDDKFITSGGHVQGAALQLRFALSDRLAIIATKDGYVHLQPDAAVPDEHGFLNVAGGVKYAFYKDDAAGMIATAGLRYEIPMGDDDLFQAGGEGGWNPFLSAGWTDGEWNLIGGTGFRIYTKSEDSSFYDLDLHLSRKFGDFYPTVEFNLVNVVDEGSQLPIPDEGFDIFNFGASESSGKTMTSLGIGARYRITDGVDFGASYQFPLNDGSGNRITDWRVTTDLVVSIG